MELSQAVDFIKHCIETNTLDWNEAIKAHESSILLKSNLTQEEQDKYSKLLDEKFKEELSTIYSLLDTLPDTSEQDYFDKFSSTECPSKKHSAWKIERISRAYSYLKGFVRAYRSL